MGVDIVPRGLNLDEASEGKIDDENGRLRYLPLLVYDDEIGVRTTTTSRKTSLSFFLSLYKGPNGAVNPLTSRNDPTLTSSSSPP